MALKKSELYASLWKSCDELRGGMDASQYKDYVLVLLFVKYISDKAASQPDYLLDVPEGASFADMVALRGNKDIGEKMMTIIYRLAEANDLLGVINVADFSDPEKLGRGKEMVDRLSNLIGIFNSPALDFRGNRAEGDDLLGDAYEYLMRHFATESGKSKGQFYTPAEVSRILAKVVGMSTARSAGQTVYDPTCGSGSLLLKAHDEARSTTGLDLAIYGQEMDVATAALARMNMILHDAPTAEITPGGYSTLANPQFRNRDGSLKTFDYVVANPPFSNKSWRNGFDPAHDEFGRFSAPYVLPPAKNGDYAFLLHILASLKSTGKAAVILPHGVLFRGNADGVIRREMVRRGYVKGVIGLPVNLFYGTTIAACIVVLDKEDAATRNGIFMVDASQGFRKDGNKNRLRAQDIHRIVDVFSRRLDVPGYSRFVPLSEIEVNRYNLNLPRYISGGPGDDLQDIDAHLRGGIPNHDVEGFAKYWEVFPNLRETLFGARDRPGYSTLRVERDEVKPTIFGHAEFTAFVSTVMREYEAWEADARGRLCAIAVGDRPKALIHLLSEALLDQFRSVPVLDPYDVYQRLLDYWEAELQDDVYLIAQSGWMEAARVREIIPSTDKNGKTVWSEAHDFALGKRRFKSDLIPGALLVANYLSANQAEIAELEERLAAIEAEITDALEVHGGEGGALEDALDDAGKPSHKAIKQQLAMTASLDDVDEERAELERLLDFLQRQAKLKSDLKAANREMQVQIAEQYGRLTEAEIKRVVVEEKWLAQLRTAVEGELYRVSTALASRIQVLSDRYHIPLPDLERQADDVADRVRGHLKAMDPAWSRL